MATDWTALKVEYINGSMQYKELAEKHKLKEGTVRQRANRENWANERNALHAQPWEFGRKTDSVLPLAVAHDCKGFLWLG